MENIPPPGYPVQMDGNHGGGHSLLDGHVDELCQKLDIKRVVKPGRGHAKVKRRKIQHAPILDDDMAYFVALHEIGHVVVGMQETRLKREAEAWKWSLTHCIIEPRYDIRQRVCSLLWRYVVRAMSNDWPLPEPEHDYWLLMNWWDPLTLGSEENSSNQDDEAHDADRSQANS